MSTIARAIRTGLAVVRAENSRDLKRLARATRANAAAVRALPKDQQFDYQVGLTLAYERELEQQD